MICHPRLFAVILTAGVSTSAVSQEFGTDQYCMQLANIGANSYQAKKDGHSMGQVLQTIGNVLRGNPQKRDAAQGVVIAVYGDNSIRSSSAAYNIVYSACKQ
jgi:hypothetical protein